MGMYVHVNSLMMGGSLGLSWRIAKCQLCQVPCFLVSQAFECACLFSSHMYVASVVQTAMECH